MVVCWVSLTLRVRTKQQALSLSPINYTVGVRRVNISNLHDSYNFLSLEKMPSIHIRSFIEKQSISFYLLKTQARIWRSTINSKHGAHLVQKPQSIYCCIWDIFSDCHIIYFHTFLTRHFLGTKIDRYICQFNFLQTKQKNIWLRCLYCLWNSVAIIWEGY